MPAFLDRAPVVGAVAAGSPAERGGIKPGDRIVKVAGREVATWEQLSMAIGTKARREVSVEVVRGGQALTAERDARRADASSRSATSASSRTSTRRSRQVLPGEPAEKAGLKAGDVVMAVQRPDDHLRARS